MLYAALRLSSGGLASAVAVRVSAKRLFSHSGNRKGRLLKWRKNLKWHLDLIVATTSPCSTPAVVGRGSNFSQKTSKSVPLPAVCPLVRLGISQDFACAPSGLYQTVPLWTSLLGMYER